MVLLSIAGVLQTNYPEAILRTSWKSRFRLTSGSDKFLVDARERQGKPQRRRTTPAGQLTRRREKATYSLGTL